MSEQERSVTVRSWLALLALVLAGVGIFSMIEKLEREAKENRLVQQPPIDYTFTRVDYSALDEKGQLRVLVSAKTMIHDRNEKSLVLELPRVRRLNASTSALSQTQAVQTLDSRSAKIFDQGKRVLLEGDVRLLSKKQNAEDAELRVDDLTLMAEEKIAFTESTVAIQQGSTTVTGRGLRADFTAQEFEITHDFQSTILPRR
jgi:LPS export ABC transporter protein LptC